MSDTANDEIVVLLHGMARTKKSMAGMDFFLASNGFKTLSLDYPSRHKKLDALAQNVADQLAGMPEIAQAKKVHFVTHSMGGLVARRLIKKYRLPNLGRLITLGTPHRGTEVADGLKNWKFFRFAYGPAGQELTTDHQARHFPDRDVDFDLGVIAGTKGWPYLLGNLLLRGPHDGRVTVESTKVPGMKGHLVLPIAHSFMMDHPEVKKQTLAFLKHGRFTP